LIDTVEPIISINSPVDAGSYNESVYLDVIYYDLRLFNATTTVYFPNGSVFYTDNVDDINTTTYNVSINFTSINFSVYGVYNVTARACDSHTNNKPNFDDWNILKNLDNSGIDFGNCDVYFDGNSNKIDILEYTCEDDRCDWKFSFRNNEHDPSFIIHCEQPITYLPQSESDGIYGHLVSGNNWIDANTIENYPVTTTRIDDNTYRYTYEGSDYKTIKTESIGELNSNNRDITFTYVNGSLTTPDFMQPGVCNDSLEGVLFMLGLLLVSLILIIFAWVSKTGFIGFFAALMMMVCGFSVIACSTMFGYVLLGLSIVLLVWSCLISPAMAR